MIVVVLAFVLRVTFPLELEWMEGGALLQARRLLAGEPIYGPPSVDYVPFLYTPGYGVVLAALGLVFPLSLTLARLVSILATFATAIGIAVIVRDESDRGGLRGRRVPIAGWLAIGLYFSSYVFTYRWMDVARGDSLLIALLVWGAWSLRWSAVRPRLAVLAGLLLAAAFWTKQTAFVVIVGLGVGALALVPWASLVITGLVLAVTCLGGVVLVDARTEGWFWRWIYEAHQSHPFNAERFWRKSAWMVVHAAPFATALLSITCVKALRTRDVEPRIAGYWTSALVAAALVSALGYSTLWAEANAFLPLTAFGAIWIGAAIGGGFAGAQPPVADRETPPARPAVWQASLVAAQLLYALVLEPNAYPIQQRGFAGLASSWLLQDPWRTLPTSSTRARATEFVDELRLLPGPTLVLSRPWWNVLAGGHGHVGSMGLNDVASGDRARLERELASQVRRGEWPSIVTEGEPPRWLSATLAREYRVARELRGEARVRPMTGWMSAAGMPVPWRGTQRVWVRVAGPDAPTPPTGRGGVYPAAP
jgi:hypothetical protein